jgi:hypothetical protein
MRTPKPRKPRRPPLDEDLILSWADAYFERSGEWPTINAGSIPEANGYTWCAVNSALQQGIRGLPRKTTLARLLEEKRGKRNSANLPALDLGQILTWAEEQHPGTTWQAIEAALKTGRRGLPGGSSVAKLIRARRPGGQPTSEP